MSSRIETVRYWAGQKLLHSPFHDYYLKLTGRVPRPQNYHEWLISEGPRLGSATLPKGYHFVLPPDTCLSPDAEAWFAQAIAESDADLLYADEDVIDVDGYRRDPVFKPAWSPELLARCNYLGGAYVIREGAAPGEGKAVHIPRVLFHRSLPARYEAQAICPPCPRSSVAVIVCSRTPALAAACLSALRSTTNWPRYEIVLIDHGAEMHSIADRYGARRVSYEAEFNFGVDVQPGGARLLERPVAVSQ